MIVENKTPTFTKLKLDQHGNFLGQFMIIPLTIIPVRSQWRHWNLLKWMSYDVNNIVTKKKIRIFFMITMFFPCWSLEKEENTVWHAIRFNFKNLEFSISKYPDTPLIHKAKISTPQTSRAKRRPRMDQNNLWRHISGDHPSHPKQFFWLCQWCHRAFFVIHCRPKTCCLFHGPSHSHCSIVCYEPQVLQQHEVNDRWDCLCSNWLGHVLPCLGVSAKRAKYVLHGNINR